MAEELKCVLMSTPKYQTTKTRRTVQDDRLLWSPESIVAPGNLKSHSFGTLPGDEKRSEDHNVNNYQWDTLHPPPPYPQTLTPPSSASRSQAPPPPYSSHPHLNLNNSKFFGSPSSPSPLDRVRTIQRERAAQLGLPAFEMEASFEGNQSFPKASRARICQEPAPGDVTMTNVNPKRGAGLYQKAQNFQGDGMNDISFSNSQPRKKYFPRLKDVSMTTGNNTSGNKSLSESWSFSGFLGAAQSPNTFPSTVRNPNKAICTITAASSEILTANDMACELFGYEENQLVGRPLKDMLRLKSKEQEVVKETHLEPSGQIVSLAGKVVEVLDSNGLVLPVSLWVKRLDGVGSTSSTAPSLGLAGRRCSDQRKQEPRLLCVMEPVERTVGHVQFDSEGEIQWCDDHMAQLCGYAGPHQMCGLNMQHLIPAFLCPDPSEGLTKEVKKQRATGRTRDGMSFPLSIVVRPADDTEDGRWIPPGQDPAKKEDQGNAVYQATVWVFANISGMISLKPDGTIHSLNENFARLLFGYARSELVGHSISKLIPDFFGLLDMESNPLPLPPMDDDEEEEEEGVELLFDAEKNCDRNTSNSAASPRGEDLLPTTSTPLDPAVANQTSSDKTKSSSRVQWQEEPPTTPKGKPRDRDVSPRLQVRKSFSASLLASADDSHRQSSGSGTRRTDLKDSLRREAVSREADTRSKNRSDDKPEACVVDESTEAAALVGEEETVADKDDEMSCGSGSAVSRDAGCDTLKNNDGNDVLNQDSTPKSLAQTDTEKEFAIRQSLPNSDEKEKVKEQNAGGDNVNRTSSECDMVSDRGDKPIPKPSPVEGRSALSPIKPVKNGLFGALSLSDMSDDAGNVSCMSDSTTDLLTAKVPACEISDLISSEDEGQGESSGQGVVADVSGNGDDSVNRGKDASISNQKRSVRLGSSCFRSKIISDGLDSGSTTSDDSGPVEEKLRSLLPLHTPRSFLTANGSSSDTYLDDESSYFSRDGTGVLSSDPSADTSGSRTSGNGKSLSSDSSGHRDLSAERMRHGNGNSSMFHTASQGRLSVDDSNSFGDSQIQGYIPEGSFSGQGRHKDGGFLGVVFQIRRVTLNDGSEMLLLWLSRDPEDACDASRSHGNLTLASSFNSTFDQSHNSLGELLQDQANSESKLGDIKELEPQDRHKEPSLSNRSQDDVSPTDEVSIAGVGEYSQHYATLTSIGKGAFGFVKLSRRLSDDREVVVKFIRRAKVLRESWIKDSKLGVVPMEVFLLSRLQHSNIVTVVDVFQNDDFIQLVMDRHGSGMDLFEFIDRNPRMDEPLTSYIFRQMVSGVSYLHSQNIVHRDIKDENIIINEHFNIKLIDFGAAAYMLPGKVFGTFCGTIEYCSPEVLMGNKYRGPELELWSMGITLYTLIFGENPFFDVEETLEGVLKPPTQVSRALMFLITWLLHPDPLCRATIGDVERNAWVNQTVDASQYQWDRVLPNTEFHGNTACDNRQDTPEHKDSGDSRVNLTPKRNDSLSDTSDHSGHAEKEINSSPGSLHHNRTSRKASRDRIEDVVTGFNRLLQMHDSLDSDN